MLSFVLAGLVLLGPRTHRGLVASSVSASLFFAFYQGTQVLLIDHNRVSNMKARNHSVSVRREIGSCVLKASVDRVSVDTLGRYVDRLSVDTHVGRHPPILHRHSADTRPRLYRHSASTTLIWSALVTEFYLLYSTVR